MNIVKEAFAFTTCVLIGILAFTGTVFSIGLIFGSIIRAAPWWCGPLGFALFYASWILSLVAIPKLYRWGTK